MPEFEDISAAITALKVDENVVLSQRKEWKRLRRSLVEVQTNSNQKPERLRHNDPTTYFDMALHLLTSRPIRWELASVPQDDEQEQREYSKGERALDSIIYQNDVSRRSRGKDRAHRALGENALEQGKTVLYYDSTTGPTGELQFRIDPVNPSTTWERFDDDGMAEFLHETEVSDTWLRNKAIIAGWEIPAGVTGQVTLQDYWVRIPSATPGRIEWRNVINVGRSRNQFAGTSTNQFTAFTQTLNRIPWRVDYYNGESDATNQIEKGRSILDINTRLYDDKHTYLNKLDIHMDETLTSPGNASTVGARPAVDSRLLDARSGNRGVYYYDASRGESALTFSQIPPIDRSTTLLLESADKGIENGGVSQFFLGQISHEFSGVALRRLEELTLSAVGEIGVGLAAVWSEVGTWILETIKENVDSNQTWTGFVPSLNRSGFAYEDISASDLSDYLAVGAIIDIALPNDLTERISQFRQAAPSSGDLIPKRVGYELFFGREIPDARGVSDELEEEQVRALPEMRLMRVHAALMRERAKVEGSGAENEALALEIIDREIALIENSFNRSGRQEDPVAGSFPPGVQPPAEQI